jgi:hypothetical protein
MAFTTPLQDHAVNCTHKYINAAAGNRVERAVVDSLSKGTQVLSRQDHVTDGFLFMHQNPADKTEYKSDCTIFHQAREVHVDVSVMFTHAKNVRNRAGADPVSSATEKQDAKRKNYHQKLIFVEDSFVAFGLDASGGWSPDATRLVREIGVQRKQQRRGHWAACAAAGVAVPIPEMRRMAETISIEMVKAMALFMQPVRTGRLYNGLAKPEATTLGAIRTERRRRGAVVDCISTATADPQLDEAVLAQLQVDDVMGLALLFDDIVSLPDEDEDGELDEGSNAAEDWIALAQAIDDEVTARTRKSRTETVDDTKDEGRNGIEAVGAADGDARAASTGG